MTKRRSAASLEKARRVRRATGIARNELRSGRQQGVTFASPVGGSATAPPVKVLSPELRALIDAARAARGSR